MADRYSHTRRTGRSGSLRSGRKRGRTNRRIMILAMELILLVVIFGGYFALSKWDMMEHITLANEDIVVNDDIDESYINEISQGYTNIAVFGVDAREDRESSVVSGVNCDVIIIASINNDTGDIKLASVYRDTLLQMPDGTYNKANYCLAMWDATKQMNMLNENLDLDLRNYVVVSWSSVAMAINMMGGIDVDVPESMFTDNWINGYITETVEATGIGSSQLTGPGLQHLDGVQAVAFCRVRYTDSDFGRTERQRLVINTMLERAKTLTPTELMSLVNQILPQVATTMDPADVLAMASKVSSYNIAGQTGWPFYNQSIGNYRYAGWWPVIPQGLDVNVSQLHEFLFGETGYVPSSTVQTISQKLQADTGLGAPAETTVIDGYVEATAAAEEEVPQTEAAPVTETVSE